MFSEIFKHSVKIIYIISPICEGWLRECTTRKKCAGISQHARHMKNQFVRSSNLWSGTKCIKSLRRSTERFLCSIR